MDTFWLHTNQQKNMKKKKKKQNETSLYNVSFNFCSGMQNSGLNFLSSFLLKRERRETTIDWDHKRAAAKKRNNGFAILQFGNLKF